MAAFYLKGIAPPHVQLKQIFAGCMPFLFMVFVSMVARLCVSRAWRYGCRTYIYG